MRTEDLEHVGEAADMIVEGMQRFGRSVFDSSLQLLEFIKKSFAVPQQTPGNTEKKETES